MVATIMIINTMIRMCILIEERIILDDLIINVKTFIHIKVVEGGGGGGGGSYNYYNQYPTQQSTESQKRPYHDSYYTNRNNADYTASYSTSGKYDQSST